MDVWMQWVPSWSSPVSGSGCHRERDVAAPCPAIAQMQSWTGCRLQNRCLREPSGEARRLQEVGKLHPLQRPSRCCPLRRSSEACRGAKPTGISVREGKVDRRIHDVNGPPTKQRRAWASHVEKSRLVQHLEQGDARHNVRGCAADELSHVEEELQVVIGWSIPGVP